MKASSSAAPPPPKPAAAGAPQAAAAAPPVGSQFVAGMSTALSLEISRASDMLREEVSSPRQMIYSARGSFVLPQLSCIEMWRMKKWPAAAATPSSQMAAEQAILRQQWDTLALSFEARRLCSGIDCHAFAPSWE